MYPINPFPETAKPNTSYIHMSSDPMHPFSRGYIHINTSDPLVPPLIETNTFDFSVGEFSLVATTATFTRLRVSLVRPRHRAGGLEVHPQDRTVERVQAVHHQVRRPAAA